MHTASSVLNTFGFWTVMSNIFNYLRYNIQKTTDMKSSHIKQDCVKFLLIRVDVALGQPKTVFTNP